MANEKSLDFNPGAQAPAAPGQAQNNSASDQDDKEFDDILKTEDEKIEIDDDDDEDTVVVSKKAMKKILEARDNYRKGIISAKDKLKALKKNGNAPAAAPAAPAQPAAPTNPDPIREAVQAESQKAREKEAIKKACEDKIVDEHWQEIMPFIPVGMSRESVDTIVEGIMTAKETYLKKHPELLEEEDDDAAAELAAVTRKPSVGNRGGDQKPKRKSIIPVKTPVSSWYK